MKTRQKTSSKTMIILMLAILFIACNNDDDTPQLAEWEAEVIQLTAATAKYADINTALDEGFIDVSGFVPNMGHHYLFPPRVDNAFELDKPEILLYAPNSNGNMEFVAVEYVVPIIDLDNPGFPPEGFTGDVDAWEINAGLSQWQLHVWIAKENPDGIFSPHNPDVGNGN
jgi:hypothetical protein